MSVPAMKHGAMSVPPLPSLVKTNGPPSAEVKVPVSSPVPAAVKVKLPPLSCTTTFSSAPLSVVVIW